ncbi:MAG: lipopolysaccharide heptosyltransferase II [Candidatus Omnitrophica bacterium]|nr:lipopolysaccharide heptosyltransferase II [Candidatus Omnitrophota bacterium]MBU4478951.1 lipopolysaccharide heptosyltransferase II [Candidatus Omnitrophota bacterium]MCG2703906.1 lipopolysaccharide heptosyltransferase II [Candidatus Omnitrophota bacterium]
MKKKILVINVNWIGDVIFSVPAVKALRRHYPEAHIACLVIARCEEVLKENPYINEIIVYDERGKHRSLWAKVRFIRYLRKKRFDEAYILHPALKRALIGFLAGIPKRIGYNTKRRSFLLTTAVPPPDVLLHKVDYFLYLLAACGIESRDRTCEFFLSSEDIAAAERILDEAGIKGAGFVILNPGGNWRLKRWPAINFARLADCLIEQNKAKIIIAGARKDQGVAQEITSNMKHKPVLVTGTTSLHELGALMKKALCVVTADSGPMHISAAVGANTIALFGPTSSRLTGPLGKGNTVILQKNVDCEIPCYDSDCANNRCMLEITVDEVYQETCKFLR